MHSNPIDQIMEKASLALAERRYFECEQLCMDAMDEAKSVGDFERFSRILMPLQEVRRMRRQCAEDAGCFIITEKHEAEVLLASYPEGCLILSAAIYAEADLDALTQLAYQKQANIQAAIVSETEFESLADLNPADLQAWFCKKLEKIGDAKLAPFIGTADLMAKIEALHALLPEVGDHEIAHQTLAKTARAFMIAQ